jgi:hypothetical protein
LLQEQHTDPYLLGLPEHDSAGQLTQPPAAAAAAAAPPQTKAEAKAAAKAAAKAEAKAAAAKAAEQPDGPTQETMEAAEEAAIGNMLENQRRDRKWLKAGGGASKSARKRGLSKWVGRGGRNGGSGGGGGPAGLHIYFAREGGEVEWDMLTSEVPTIETQLPPSQPGDDFD